MASNENFYVGKRSITSGRKTHSANKVVTPEIMGMTDDEFAAAVERGGIKKGTPPKAAKARAPEKKIAGVNDYDKNKKPGEDDQPVLREDRIAAAIKDLFKEDGSHKSEDDFTADGKPRTDSLDVIALLEGEGEISAAERDVAWDKYLTEKDAG